MKGFRNWLVFLFVFFLAACSSSYSVYAEETKAEATRVEESKEEGVRCDPYWWDMNDDDQQLRNWFD